MQSVILMLLLLLGVLLIIYVALVLIAKSAEKTNHPDQAGSIYKILVIYPVSRDVSFAGLGDTQFVSRNFGSAEESYKKGLRYSTDRSICSIYIKLGDSQFNQVEQATDTVQKQRLLRLAIDNYKLCLEQDSGSSVAKERLKKSEEELNKLDKDNSEQPTDPKKEQHTNSNDGQMNNQTRGDGEDETRQEVHW